MDPEGDALPLAGQLDADPFDPQLLAEGETRHMVIDRQGRARTFPSRYAAYLRQPNEDQTTA